MGRGVKSFIPLGTVKRYELACLTVLSFHERLWSPLMSYKLEGWSFLFGQKIRAFLHGNEMKYIYQVEFNLFHSKKSSPPSQTVCVCVCVSAHLKYLSTKGNWFLSNLHMLPKLGFFLLRTSRYLSKNFQHHNFWQMPG